MTNDFYVDNVFQRYSSRRFPIQSRDLRKLQFSSFAGATDINTQYTMRHRN